jgi:hypothetical protein
MARLVSKEVYARRIADSGYVNNRWRYRGGLFSTNLMISKNMGKVVLAQGRIFGGSRW